MTSPRLAAVALAGVALALVSCSPGSGSGEGANPADPTTAPSGTGAGAELAFTSPDADDFNRPLASEDGLSDLQPVQILGVEADGSARVVVSFEMESHHCHGIQATVEETDTEVVLDLQTGRRPGVSPAACSYGVYPYTATVELAAPLGQRALATATERTDPTTGTTTPTDASETTTGEAGPEQPAATGIDRVDPAQVDPGDVAADEVDRYLGRHVEDGVEWALAHDRPWRILSLDGVPVEDDGPEDPERLSFVVVADVIVAYEWS